ncbi:MAG: replication/maintenance protein RepL [Bacteroidetes bacterium]|nr:replication/maintenance protein RepL [Bacteroidota bacterium]
MKESDIWIRRVMYFKTEKNHLWIDGHKMQPQKEEIIKEHLATGLKLIFLLLKNESLLNMPQRTMAEKAGIALGNVNYILSGLKEYNFLIQKEKGTLQIINKQELLHKWITGYDDMLKPKLHLANFRFSNLENERNWMNLNLKYQTYWGGEPAGAILTKYLNPEIFTLYTEESRNQLIKNYHLIPDQDGNVKVYRKFWNDNDEMDGDKLHPIIVYADLVNTGNDRCLETAKIIYGKYIK